MSIFYSVSYSVSTHSRAEAAAFDTEKAKSELEVSTHSRAEAAAAEAAAPYLKKQEKSAD